MVVVGHSFYRGPFGIHINGHLAGKDRINKNQNKYEAAAMKKKMLSPRFLSTPLLLTIFTGFSGVFPGIAAAFLKRRIK